MLNITLMEIGSQGGELPLPISPLPPAQIGDYHLNSFIPKKTSKTTFQHSFAMAPFKFKMFE